MNSTDSAELRTLLNIGLAGVAAGAKDMAHLDGAAAACNYIRVADLIESHYKRTHLEAPVLDWGCGYGQVSWLLQQRGVPVVSCDVDERPLRQLVEPLNRLEIRHVSDPPRLPYASGTFGIVLSVGVLEHVGAENVEASLREISRVLKPGGYLFIFMLPNKFSWVEFLSDVNGTSVHPDKYTFGRIRRILSNQSFIVRREWRRNVLPRNLTGLSQRIKSAYGRYYRQIESLDSLLSALPPLSLFSGVIEVVAQKR
jgi:SAM-dependent methyltransferase